jgi:hypothetical protein
MAVKNIKQKSKMADKLKMAHLTIVLHFVLYLNQFLNIFQNKISLRSTCWTRRKSKMAEIFMMALFAIAFNFFRFFSQTFICLFYMKLFWSCNQNIFQYSNIEWNLNSRWRRVSRWSFYLMHHFSQFSKN